MAHSLMVRTVDIHQLASVVRNRIDNALVLDGRSFLEYNASHIVNAINVGCAKLMKRRLQQDKLSIEDFLAQNCHWNVDRDIDIIVYDQSTCDPRCLPVDSFMGVFLQKLLSVYNCVSLLKGGFLEFQAAYPDLCEDERAKFAPLTSLSQPCLPITNHGPTRILPFLYLGSQTDALNQEILQHYNITYQLNVSTNCPKPDFIQDSHFMRIPVIDNYSEKLLPYFPNAFQFLDKARESGGCVLIHCLAGISRSATVAIAYVMKTLRMTSDEAYRYVKAKRTNVSPNFNFLGQLLEYEKQLQRESVLVLKSESSATPLFNSSSPLSVQSYNKSSHCDFSEDSSVCSQKQITNTYYVKYADEAESASGETVRDKDNHLTFKKSVSACTYNYIPCKASSSVLNIKCLPVSSLKELNFTPCQTSKSDKVYTKDIAKPESGLKSPTSNFTTYQASWSDRICSKDSLVHKNSLRSPVISPSPTSPKKTDIKRINPVLELHLENIRGPMAVSPDFISPGDYKPFEFDPKAYSNRVSPGDFKTFEFDAKTYNRSDSVSTSGLGSEGSDCADSWNDFTSSCERETDVSMDEDYSSVPSEDGILRSCSKVGSDSDRFEYSYEDSMSFYPKYEHFVAKHYVQRESAQTVPTAKFHSSKYEDNSSQLPTDFGKTHMLYRAQSCPGMLSSDCSTDSTTVSVRLRKSKTKFSEDKCRNRFSCSSIDYMDYTSTLNFEQGPCLNAPKSTDLSSSHCNYRHSMIQVS